MFSYIILYIIIIFTFLIIIYYFIFLFYFQEILYFTIEHEYISLFFFANIAVIFYFPFAIFLIYIILH